ncbi:E3 ubiquitin-protein ligase At1g63170-like isoform X2 [Cicer arietinum]|uniref:E3 ubiquitin-protein ligase At1g63170-like isoform X2 n=1 Tax=Cicer arietinum TaxID=3827 RepID=A0A1S2Y909_CICAR|nr:E3 ubiquitin-protein ligase At1g63170-like isoform X2 [Cicer arietinum]
MEGAVSPQSEQGLLMAQQPNHHVIDITETSHETETSPIRQTSVTEVDFRVARLRVSSNGSNSRMIRGDSRGEGGSRRTPLNSGLWISLELFFTVIQIVASLLVLFLSKNEHPHAPLFAWIVGYASGCVVSLPLLFWRYYARRDQSPTIDDPSGTLLSNSSTIQGEEDVPVASSGSNRASWLMNPRLKILMEYFKIAVDCFFAIWFVVGNVWIFGGHSSANEAPNMYRLCVVFLTFSCVGYAMPFILCVTICCCLPCIISTLGVTEDLTQTRGATTESINALPTHKFKLNRNKSRDESTPDVFEGGVVAGGTEKERMISGEDAVCCICIANYENNDDLRELPCSHLFHKECVDTWLKINALCPLCKSEVGNVTDEPAIGENTSQQRGDENGLANTSL